LFVLIAAAFSPLHTDTHLTVNSYTAFLLGLLFVLIAATFSALDATGTWCDPNAIVTGHPLWHLFSAAGLWFLFVGVASALALVTFIYFSFVMLL
jgi:hypothetical protein